MWLRSTVLCWLVVLVVVPAGWGSQARRHGLGHRPPTPAEQAYVDAVYTKVTRVEANDLARERVRAEAEAARARGEAPPRPATLPTTVDNSTLQYFPPIGDQGLQGSCTCWAACYYYNTYTQAMDEGYDVSSWDPDHTLSPAFMYPLVNDGVDLGAYTQYVVGRLNDVGACSWSLKAYNVSDWTSWPSEAAWVQALNNRTDSASVIDGSTPSGLDAIKQHLANGNIAATDFLVYETWCCYWNGSYPGEPVGISNEVYYYPDGYMAGGHAVTIVGYDDDKMYIDHRDGLPHYGAFLMANSWGKWWGVGNSTGGGPGDCGYFWVAYNMFLEETFGPLAYYNEDRPDYRPKLYAVAGINHAERGYVYMDAPICGCPPVSDYAPINCDGGTALEVTDAERIAADMTDIIPSSPGDFEVAVYVQANCLATTDATITSADFYHDLDGDGSYEVTPSEDPPVTIAPYAWGVATAVIPAATAAPEVLLEVYPNERGLGPQTTTLKPGGPYWVWPTPSGSGGYTWKTYKFGGSASLWVQVCAQAYGAFQNKPKNGFGNQDTLVLVVDGVTPTDVWGIQSGPLGNYQWKGDADQGRRVELEFLVTGLAPGPHTLRLTGSMCPSIYWVKVYDLEPRYAE